ncbi:MAG: hypothetical protein AD742_06430 [Methylibium sp. NZG]|nr:MAG: hypothetical protein AD742_06430 [Methylibium sp. NZG]
MRGARVTVRPIQTTSASNSATPLHNPATRQRRGRDANGGEDRSLFMARILCERPLSCMSERLE